MTFMLLFLLSCEPLPFGVRNNVDVNDHRKVSFLCFSFWEFLLIVTVNVSEIEWVTEEGIEYNRIV